MALPIHKWLNKTYPRNYILRKPVIGTAIFAAFCFGFVTLYKPLQIHEARTFGLQLTIAIYCLALSLPIIGLVEILKQFRFFSEAYQWNIFKELVSILIILAGMGIAVYIAGFIIETPADRLNLGTFADSMSNTFLIGIIPFGLLTVTNYRFLFVSDIAEDYKPENDSALLQYTEELIRIGSKLKKEEVSFFPGQFIYAESDGNYVVFHLDSEGKPVKKIVRNSINNVENQLLAIPFLMRTHRAFIVNLKKVHSKKGNTLGYRLKLAGTDAEIPVSRQNTHDFDLNLKKYL